MGSQSVKPSDGKTGKSAAIAAHKEIHGNANFRGLSFFGGAVMALDFAGKSRLVDVKSLVGSSEEFEAASERWDAAKAGERV